MTGLLISAGAGAVLFEDMFDISGLGNGVLGMLIMAEEGGSFRVITSVFGSLSGNCDFALGFITGFGSLAGIDFFSACCAWAVKQNEPEQKIRIIIFFIVLFLMGI